MAFQIDQEAETLFQFGQLELIKDSIVEAIGYHLLLFFLFPAMLLSA